MTSCLGYCTRWNMKSFVNLGWENLFSSYYVPGPVLIPLGSEYLSNLINIIHSIKYLCWDSTPAITKVYFSHFNVYFQAWESTDTFWESNHV